MVYVLKIVYSNLFFCVERDPNSSLPPPLIGGYRPTVFGEEPPENEGYDELCPKRECPDCKRMHALRCEGSAKMYGLTILPYDTNFPGLPNRTGSKLYIFIIRKWFRISSIGEKICGKYFSNVYNFNEYSSYAFLNNLMK